MKCGAVLGTLHDVVCQKMSGHEGRHKCTDINLNVWSWEDTPHEQIYPAEDRSLT